jgi:hypothetical protein
MLNIDTCSVNNSSIPTHNSLTKNSKRNISWQKPTATQLTLLPTQQLQQKLNVKNTRYKIADKLFNKSAEPVSPFLLFF